MTPPAAAGRPVLPELPIWRRIRQYAVPARMIEECAAARAAGDWRAACAAGRVDVTFGLAEVVDVFGRDAAEGIERDLLAFAPDLLRWHLPRVLGGRTGIATGQRFALSLREGRVLDDEPVLVLHTPKTVDGSQRMRLGISLSVAPDQMDLPPAFWSAAHAGGLRAAYGGGPARMPGFEPDGAVRRFESYSYHADRGDPASRAEAFDRRVAGGDPVAAWAVAGIGLDPAPFQDSGNSDAGYADNVAAGRIVPLGLVAELSRLHARYGITRARVGTAWTMPVVLAPADDGGVAARFQSYTRELLDVRQIAPPVYGRPADLELVRHGLLDVAELHPLVRGALFPPPPAAAAPGTGHPDPRRPDPGALDLRRSVRVRCGGEWHTVAHGHGRLDLTAHPAEEVRREQTLSALGGRVSGCVAALRAWHGSPDRLPRPLRELRREVLHRVQHGGSAALTELLDAGLDPLMCDGSGGTLLHHLREVRDTTLVRRLVDAGVPLETRNRRRSRTALHVAICDGGTPEMVRALLEAGADLQAKDARGNTAAEWAEGKGSMYAEEGETHETVDEEYQAPVMIREIVEDWLARDDH